MKFERVPTTNSTHAVNYRVLADSGLYVGHVARSGRAWIAWRPNDRFIGLGGFISRAAAANYLVCEFNVLNFQKQKQ
jgi:hypothetical protein